MRASLIQKSQNKLSIDRNANHFLFEKCCCRRRRSILQVSICFLPLHQNQFSSFLPSFFPPQILSSLRLIYVPKCKRRFPVGSPTKMQPARLQSTLKCIFLSKRLRETRVRGRQEARFTQPLREKYALLSTVRRHVCSVLGACLCHRVWPPVSSCQKGPYLQGKLFRQD